MGARHLADELEKASAHPRSLDDRGRHRRTPLPAPAACTRRRSAISSGLRAICDRHGILLIFDEVITGFRTGRCRLLPPTRSAVTPDLITCAKGMTNAAVADGRCHRQRKKNL